MRGAAARQAAQCLEAAAGQAAPRLQAPLQLQPLLPLPLPAPVSVDTTPCMQGGSATLLRRSIAYMHKNQWRARSMFYRIRPCIAKVAGRVRLISNHAVHARPMQDFKATHRVTRCMNAMARKATARTSTMVSGGTVSGAEPGLPKEAYVVGSGLGTMGAMSVTEAEELGSVGSCGIRNVLTGADAAPVLIAASGFCLGKRSTRPSVASPLCTALLLYQSVLLNNLL